MAEQLDVKPGLDYQKDPTEHGLDCHYQNEKASAGVALTKGVMGQKITFAAAGTGLRIVEGQPVETVEQNSDLTQNVSLGLASSAWPALLSQQLDFLES